MLSKLVSVFVLIAFVSGSNALTVGPFETVTNKNVSEFWDAFRNGARYYNGYAYINNSIWFTSARITFSQLSWSNMVARLDLSDNTWTHFPVSGLDNTRNNFVFTLAGRLFMLVANFRNNKIPAERLLVWNQDRWQDVQVSLPVHLCDGPTEYNDVYIAVSNQTGSTAYVGASCWTDDSTTTMGFHKLTVDTSTTPISAQLTPLAKGQSDIRNSLSWTFERNGSVMATSRHNRPGCWFCLQENQVHIVAAGSNAVTSGAVSRPDSVQSWTRVDDAVQVEKYALFMGGRISNTANNAEVYSSQDEVFGIRSLNLDTLTWSDTGVNFPAGHRAIIDQVGKRLFALSFSSGLKVARITL